MNYNLKNKRCSMEKIPRWRQKYIRQMVIQNVKSNKQKTSSGTFEKQ